MAHETRYLIYLLCSCNPGVEWMDEWIFSAISQNLFSMKAEANQMILIVTFSFLNDYQCFPWISLNFLQKFLGASSRLGFLWVIVFVMKQGHSEMGSLDIVDGISWPWFKVKHVRHGTKWKLRKFWRHLKCKDFAYILSAQLWPIFKVWFQIES
jgi:hypothetical protein